jgi:catechol 2,3-dioxygenase-like lactoylglutathione lyase family enzyme
MSGVGIGHRCLGFGHSGLSVADIDMMSDWYQRALGLEPEHGQGEPGDPARWVWLKGDGFRIELVQLEGSKPNPNAKPRPADSMMLHGYGHICLWVKGIEEAYQSLMDLGAGSVYPPGPSLMEDFHFSYVTDPEGNQIELMESPEARLAAARERETTAASAS